MSKKTENCPLKVWKGKLLQNGVPTQTVNHLADMADQWLQKLQQDQELTPDKAFECIEESCTDDALLKYFKRYKFALFTLVQESDLTT